MKPLGIKGGAQKEPCFLLLLSAPVRNGVGFFFFGCFFFCCRFIRSRSPPPPRLLCSTTETPGGPWRHSSVCVWGPGRGLQSSSYLTPSSPHAAPRLSDETRCRTAPRLFPTRFSLLTLLPSSEHVGPHWRTKLEQVWVK